jgi:integration host factor subunit beta
LTFARPVWINPETPGNYPADSVHDRFGSGGRRMTKSELIEAVAEKANLTKSKAEAVVNTLFSAMTDTMVKGDGIEIRGFGSFTVRTYGAYSGRNPRTGAVVQVSPKRLPFFKVGKEMKETVNIGDAKTEPPAAPPAQSPPPASNS